MKQKRLCAVQLIALAAVFSCATASSPRQEVTQPVPRQEEAASPDGLSLDEGIRQAAVAIEAGLPEGTYVAAVNFESPSAYFSDYVLEELQFILVTNRKLVVVERANLELLREEIEFQMSGMVSDESAASLGKWVGAQVIVTGSLTDIGGSYRCRFNATDVETAVRRVSPAVTVRRDMTVAYMLPAEAAPPPARVPAEAAPPPARVPAEAAPPPARVPAEAAPPPARVPAKPDPSLAVEYFNAGFAHYEAKRYTEAVAEFTRALQVKKDDTVYLRYRGLAYYYLKDYDRSIADYNEAIRLNPNYTEAYNTRGVAYDEKGEYNRAIADYKQAIRLNPNFAKAYNNRGVAYINKKNYSRAIADLNEAIRLNPNDADAYNNRGVAYRNKFMNKFMKNYNRAMADYNEAIRLNPNFAEAYNNRGVVYIEKKDYDLAMADINEAIRLNPNFAGLYVTRGNVYYYKKDYTRARANWEKALRLDPNFTPARDNLEVLRREGH